MIKRIGDHLRNGGTKERGAVAIIVALVFLPVLMGSAAMAIDVSSWLVMGGKMQKAADAAALASVVYLPGDTAQASSIAATVAMNNGFCTHTSGTRPTACPVSADSNISTTVTQQQGGRATQSKVTITVMMKNNFGGLIGKGTQSITKEAVADYSGPAPMGSPCNVMGNEVMETTKAASAKCDSAAGKYWLEVAGKNMNKVSGDAYQMNWCTSPQVGSTIDGCSATGSTAKNNNTEYNPKGYFYTVRVKKAGYLTLEGYDMAFAKTGINCENFSTATGSGYDITDISTRYKGGNTDFCSGDNDSGDNDGTATNTTVTIRGLSPDVWNPELGETWCKRTIKGFNTVNAAALKTSTGAANKDLRDTFHRWSNLLNTGQTNVSGTKCNTSNGATSVLVQPGDYSIQVNNTDAGGGENMFALRAKLTTANGSGATNADASIFAAGRVALFNNNAGSPKFHVVRLDSGTAGHQLTVSFFDYGDGSGTFGLDIYQPDNSSLNSNNTFSNCVFSGAYSATGSCSRSSMTASTFGGKWETVTIDIPANYTCNANDDESKCWVKIKMSNTSAPTDLTTWTAGFNGDPVRLVTVD